MLKGENINMMVSFLVGTVTFAKIEVEIYKPPLKLKLYIFEMLVRKWLPRVKDVSGE